MRNYELTLLLPGDRDDKTLKEILQNITSQIQEQGGIISKEQVQRRQKLLVTDKRQEGFLAVITFVMQPEKLPILETVLRAKEAVARFMLLHKPFKKILEAPALGVRAPKGLTPPPQEKATIEQIDKKLEELLKE